MIVPPVSRSAATAVSNPTAEDTDRVGASNGTPGVAAVAGRGTFAAAASTTSQTAPARQAVVRRFTLTPPSSPSDEEWPDAMSGRGRRRGRRVVEYAQPDWPPRRDVYAPALAARRAPGRIQLRLGQRHRARSLRGVRGGGAAPRPR